MKRCPSCGAKNKGRFSYCVRCSEPLNAVAEERQFASFGLSSVLSFLVLVTLLVAFVWAWEKVNPPESEAPPLNVTRPRTGAPAAPEVTAPEEAARAGSVVEARRLAREGMLAFHEDQYEKAVLLFDQFVLEAPGNPFGHMYLGLSHYFLGDEELAIASMEEAFERAPGNPGFGNYLVNMLETTEDYIRAEEVVRKYLDSASDDEGARLVLIRLIRQQGDMEAAVEEGERLVADAPESYDVVYELGECLKQNGDLRKAREMFQRAVEIETQSAPARYALGATELLVGNLESAVLHLKEAVDLDPENGIYHLSLAQAYEGSDSIEDSLDEYESFLKLSPGDPRAPKIAQLVERARKALDERNKRKT